MNRPTKPLRIAYLSGPVDAVEVYRAWSADKNLSFFGTSYLRQFYQVTADLGAECYVITTLPGAFSRTRIGHAVIENRPTPTRSGLAYHLAVALWFLRFLPRLVGFRADAIVVTALQNYWFLLCPVKLWGTAVVPSVHCVLWPQFLPLRTSWKVLRGLNRLFFAHCADAAMAVSDAIARQIGSLGPRLPVEVFLPTYGRRQFEGIAPARHEVRPFRVFFAGRIETNKGVFDLVEMADRLQRERPDSFRFDLCGEGPELERLRQEVRARGLEAVVRCHGFCDGATLSGHLAASHVVIVPTTTQFEEGFNKVCAEAVLAGRPVITSPVCPALETVRPAALEVPPDDGEAYRQALLRLADDRELFEEKRRACVPLQERFYDPGRSYGAVLRAVLGRVLRLDPAAGRPDGEVPPGSAG